MALCSLAAILKEQSGSGSLATILINWENGTKMVDTVLRTVEVPLKNVERHYFSCHPDGLPPLMGEPVSITHFCSYLKTWSAYKAYCERYPDREDVVERTIKDMKRAGNLKRGATC
ncbi:hypothetical protein B0O80DRAFT_30238 [Mortierella sp. GBAus27b]|nr:hypothetical protein B0O80DRAFT_30238 [Mortierella sp. GBAus27b]